MTEKVSFYAKKESWEKFKEQVFRSSRNLRALSGELNKIIEERTLINLEENLKKLIEPNTLKSYSLEEIKSDRPKLPVTAEQIIREMRESNVNLSR
ncbi:MAG: hypothetical protein ACXAEU_06755 [Candidatus Hodarchaeales archaeon]|jgi:regulator of replication initiation timing